MVVARQGLSGVQSAAGAQVLCSAFVLVVEVLQEFLDGAGGRLGFVVVVAVVVEPEGVSRAVDEVEQGAEVFVFAVVVAGARFVEVDEVVAFVVLSRRVAFRKMWSLPGRLRRVFRLPMVMTPLGSLLFCWAASWFSMFSRMNSSGR